MYIKNEEGAINNKVGQVNSAFNNFRVECNCREYKAKKTSEALR